MEQVVLLVQVAEALLLAEVLVIMVVMVELEVFMFTLLSPLTLECPAVKAVEAGEAAVNQLE